MNSCHIPFYDLRSENIEFKPEFEKALSRIIESGRFVLGDELKKFEQALALYLGVPQVIGLKSGTDALFYGMKALGIGSGDEVITTPFTFPATVEAILRTGAVPVLADIEPETLCLSPSAVEEKISLRTKAIVLVHLFGNCPALDRFITICQQKGIFLVEDAAQALGSTYQERKLGSFGTVATFSFYPTKNLGALGNGGAIASVALPISCPTSARLDELQAAFLLLKLNHLEKWLARRRQLAHRYTTALNQYVRIVQSVPDSTVNYHQFALLTPQRNKLRNFLFANGIETMVYYPKPIHLQPGFVSLFNNQSFPVAEKASDEIVCLPIRHNLTDAEQDVIINKIIEFFARL